MKGKAMSRFMRSRMMVVALALEFEENKKRIFKGLDENDFADLAAYYSTLK